LVQQAANELNLAKQALGDGLPDEADAALARSRASLLTEPCGDVHELEKQAKALQGEVTSSRSRAREHVAQAQRLSGQGFAAAARNELGKALALDRALTAQVDKLDHEYRAQAESIVAQLARVSSYLDAAEAAIQDADLAAAQGHLTAAERTIGEAPCGDITLLRMRLSRLASLRTERKKQLSELRAEADAASQSSRHEEAQALLEKAKAIDRSEAWLEKHLESLPHLIEARDKAVSAASQYAAQAIRHARIARCGKATEAIEAGRRALLMDAPGVATAEAELQAAADKVATVRRIRATVMKVALVLVVVGSVWWGFQRQVMLGDAQRLRESYAELERQLAGSPKDMPRELSAAQAAAEKSLSAFEDSANLGLWWRLQDGRQQLEEQLTALQRELHLAVVGQVRQRVEQAVAAKDIAAAQIAIESLKTLVPWDADRSAVTGELTAKVTGLQRGLHLAEVNQARERVEQAVAKKDVAAAQIAIESLKTLVARDADGAAITGELTAKVTILQREVFVRSARELLAQESPSPQELERVAESLRALGGEAVLVEKLFVRWRGTQAGRVAAWADVLEFEPKGTVIADAAIRARISGTGLPWKVRDRVTGIEMVLIPPGEYQRGASFNDSDAWHAEIPAHEVTISMAFYLGVTEVTQSEWSKVMGSNPSSAEGDRLPVENVSWDDIQPFLQKSSGLRLPTEGEWEYACRAGTTGSRYGQLDDVAWYDGNSGYKTHAVGGKRANAFGLHDMLGNVYEWCSDWYGSYPRSAQTNPQGPSTGGNRVMRGGSSHLNDRYCRASSRLDYAPAVGGPGDGFRVARTP
jgi:formylglycine-generating enzyme required for sulfatase activity